MSTFSKIYVKIDDIDDVVNQFKHFYTIRNIECLESPKWWYYNDYETIIIAKKDYNWVEIEIQFLYSLYVYDEFFRNLSKKNNTIVVLAYYQSAVGGGRIAKFEKGEMTLSITQTYITNEDFDKTILTDNFGVNEFIKKEFKIPNLYEEFSLFDSDFINSFLHKEKISISETNEVSYVHLERIN
ncbi:hypothetical protein ACI75Y_02305 [Capnocytophaga stomatis]|uniref:hypothetical protein n=1 Tax=Capnocytophaga stomatis TaxID=1848904 RepID=UPI00385C2A38